jgi:1,2-diacylglycerol 3-alpha-glucosyltransferase
MIGQDPANPLIGQYNDAFLPAIDGVIMTVHNYAHWLTQDYFPCYVATADVPADSDYADDEIYQIIRYKSVPLRHRTAYRFGIPSLDWSFVSSQQDLRPMLVHAHSPFMAGAEALRVSRKLKIPLVATFHSKYYDDIFQATRSRLLAETAVAFIVDFYNHCDYVWTVNAGTASTLREYGYKKAIEIMPNGTDLVLPADIEAARRSVEQRFRLAPDDKVLLFVGQHIIQKNLPMLLDAAALYSRAGGRFKLLMVGEGYAREQLAEQAKALGLGKHVIFAGMERDRERLTAIYLRADLFAFPSLYDNAPLVVREAAIAGCPSVLIAGSNAAESTRDGIDAYHCENTAESLAQTIARALADEDQRRQVGSEARKNIGRPWQDVISQVACRYTDIIAEHQANRKRRHPQKPRA